MPFNLSSNLIGTWFARITWNVWKKDYSVLWRAPWVIYPNFLLQSNGPSVGSTKVWHQNWTVHTKKKSYSRNNMIKVSKDSYFIYRNYVVFFYCATNDKTILVFNRTSRCCYKRCVKLKIWFCDIGEVKEFCFFLALW